METKDLLKTLIDDGTMLPKNRPNGWKHNDLRLTTTRNKTIPPQFQICHKPKLCDDCNLVVTNRRQTIIKYLNPIIHWRSKCMNCRRHKHPETGEYSMTTREIQNYYKQLQRSTKELTPVGIISPKKLGRPKNLAGATIEEYHDYYIIRHNQEK